MALVLGVQEPQRVFMGRTDQRVAWTPIAVSNRSTTGGSARRISVLYSCASRSSNSSAESARMSASSSLRAPAALVDDPHRKMAAGQPVPFRPSRPVSRPEPCARSSFARTWTAIQEAFRLRNPSMTSTGHRIGALSVTAPSCLTRRLRFLTRFRVTRTERGVPSGAITARSNGAGVIVGMHPPFMWRRLE